MFNVEINTGNAAFGITHSLELARILRELADKVESGQDDTVLRDMNGNRVGQSWTTEDS